jgi:hypothetical protein
MTATRESKMSFKIKAGQLWTDSVAYVALLTGAGLSIAGNVANVVRTRGVDVDTLDIVLAVAFPALVVLMVEVFVSARWRGLNWPMQVLRWFGTLSIGAVAMRVSWVHLHELMLSRGQAGDVAMLGPLAIDALAIMATALILAGRGRIEPAAVATETAAEILARRQDEMDKLAASTAPVLPTIGDEMADEARTWLDTLANSALESETTPAFPIEITPVSPAPRSNEVKAESVPESAADLISAWAGASPEIRPTPGQADALVAASHGVSPRTARRWRDALVVKTSE